MNSPLLHPPESSHGSDEKQSPHLQGTASGVRGLSPAEGSHGWTHWSWKEKRYLVASEPGSKVIFDFIISKPEFRSSARSQSYHGGGGEAFPDRQRNKEEVRNNLNQKMFENEKGEKGKLRFKKKPPLIKEERQNRYPVDDRDGGIMDTGIEGRRRKESQYGIGSVGIVYQRSRNLGLGKIACWVDDQYASAKVIDGYWDLGERNQGM